MKTLLSSSSPQLFITITLIVIAVTITSVTCLGSTTTTTIAVSYGSTVTICAITADNPIQSVQCYVTATNQSISVKPINTSFSSISGGQDFFCGLRSDGLNLHCWNTHDFLPKRIYFEPTRPPLSNLTVGDSHICAVESNTSSVSCWRSRFPPPGTEWKFRTITSGGGFSCGILLINSKVKCWGESTIAWRIETLFGNHTMLSIVAGEAHACGVTRNGILICEGRNEEGQLDVPPHSAFDFLSYSLALGRNYSCGIKRRNGIVVCWGGGWEGFNTVAVSNLSFESIVSGLDFICGLTTKNLTVICWGPGWNDEISNVIPVGIVIPGPCFKTSCNLCGIYPDSGSLCGGSGIICRQCDSVELPQPAILPPISPETLIPRRAKKRVFFIYCIVGSIGAVMGISSILYFLWLGACCCFPCKKIHDSTVQCGDARANTAEADCFVPSTSSSIKSGILRSQKSGTSSKHIDRAEEFSLPELVSATNNFSMGNKIGGGSFGIVYKGNLFDGREVAIKRGDSSNLRNNKFQEKETAFDSEISLLSRLHHKHLVELIGFCQENDERLLVYEYMSNGSLHDHLHSTAQKNNVVDSWKMRIKIALDAAKGIEYLHNYAVPPIIHRDIKSSNILLDANWTAKVSDFGLSLSGQDQEPISRKTVGTVGYIDPEYFVLQNLTAKSDVYGFGVVLLELLTGKRAVFKEEGASPTGLVEFSVPQISGGKLRNILDKRVELTVEAVEAVEMVAYTALQCVKMEGEERPNMAEIIANLERALSLCDDNSHGTISETSFS